ncbi:glutamate--cysteine ligase [Streptomyces virens]|uniref:Putative glutamate--cysteine ligase 2 n=2 Tax=Streptomyces TaxID=1883 RepID=A0A514JJT0_9ACTN|nr:glutamate--cysteine ligase [Streptomyces calvus]MYS30553.1 YbdK family carboxylate-amine ligase [Streptomyces sp. SID7804]MBA8941615.1 carboxylate-amine ligase [Streptomyces calvus]MBA8976452.1 carboxylate-amine ligase [Streptomyces calvus]QDI67560.1 carboxylate--amine ligase [Streptomyces calvus]GGP62956.1 putative glutamate--cysteine ligase 2 [Streptomyces calvus]
MRTVGVEEELLLVDPETGEPRAMSAAVLARAERDGAEPDVFEKELHEQMLEFATHPQSSMESLHAEIVRCRKEAAGHAEEIGCTVAALATSPLPVSPAIGMNRRYRWMEEQYGIATREQLVLGCHVHVSVESDEEGVGVVDRLRPWLPVLAALSANSPYWQGKDSGYSSYRSRVWQRWPSAGPTEIFGSAECYHRRVADMVATGTILDEGMIYFDARLSQRYPTVEIRVSDVCLHAETAALIATFARALVDTAAGEWRDGREPLDPGVSLLRLAAWQAARSGLTGELLDPRTMRRMPAEAVVRTLLEHAAGALEANGDLERAREGCARLLRDGNGAQVQRALMDRSGSLRDVVTECVRHTQA